MKIWFSRASEKIRSHFFSRFFEIETLVNDCPPPLKEPEIQKSLWTRHVLYFWKALGTRTPKTVFPGVRHANEQIQTQIYKDWFVVLTTVLQHSHIGAHSGSIKSRTTLRSEIYLFRGWYMYLWRILTERVLKFQSSWACQWQILFWQQATMSPPPLQSGQAWPVHLMTFFWLRR